MPAISQKVRTPPEEKTYYIVHIIFGKANQNHYTVYSYTKTRRFTANQAWQHSLALRLNSADYDGDHVLSVSSSPIISAAKRANINTILWDRIDNPSDNNQLVPISNIEKIINTSVVGMQNKIGDVINQIKVDKLGYHC